MKRGIEILIMWLIIAGLIMFFSFALSTAPSTVGLVYYLTVISFPVATWAYGGHSDRISPVICFGFVAGVITTLPFLYDRLGRPRDITLGWELFFLGVPVLMTLVCSGTFALRRYLEREDAF